MMKRWIGTGMLLLVVSMAIMAQGNRTQKVLGRVTDIHGNPLADVSLSIVNAEPSITQTTDKAGRFELQVPLGRQVLRASSVGYQDKEISLLLVMGEEVSLDVKLESATYNLKGVEVKRYYNKARPIQPLAYAGARSFSVEETERYAGSLGDPSRMVRSFAGVMPINDSRNEIVVRGNSSLGVQYRLDGIEIPNPNHFNAGLGMTAGQVTALNMNVVTNSDFLLGGWQATKGNALAAIFDLNLRKGNPNNHQMRFQMGYNGAELMTEGR
ncbi:MAG: carboxypeptidase-like regulatory domain-containing protein [Hoylesella buccalis]